MSTFLIDSNILTRLPIVDTQFEVLDFESCALTMVGKCTVNIDGRCIKFKGGSTVIDVESRIRAICQLQSGGLMEGDEALTNDDTVAAGNLYDFLGGVPVAPVEIVKMASTLIAEVLDDRIAPLVTKLSELCERTESNLSEWNAKTEATLIDLKERVHDVEAQARSFRFAEKAHVTSHSVTSQNEKEHVKSQNLTAEEALEKIRNSRNKVVPDNELQNIIKDDQILAISSETNKVWTSEKPAARFEFEKMTALDGTLSRCYSLSLTYNLSCYGMSCMSECSLFKLSGVVIDLRQKNQTNDGTLDIYMPLKAASKLTNALHESSPHPCKLRPHPSLTRVGYLVVEYKFSDSADFLSINTPGTDEVTEIVKIGTDQVDSHPSKNTNKRHVTSCNSFINAAPLHGLYNCDVILQCLGCYSLTDMRGTDILDIHFSVKEAHVVSRFIE